MSTESEPKEPRYLAGHFLIASVNLLDPNFVRTVVLLIQHNEEGAFGLVLNRPSGKELNDVLPDSLGGAVLHVPVYIGGPVQQDYLFALHSGLENKLLTPNATTPIPGVYFEPATKQLISYLIDEWNITPIEDRPKLRLYAGYSGWGPGQLERELRENSWFVVGATSSIVFHPDPEVAWKDALAMKGTYYRFVAETGYMPSIN
ncbi:MAG: YqgE/AlgH family protein [Spirochaetales bacterium]